MVNAGRVACIAAPFLLSLGALITLVLVFLAGTREGNKTTGDLYFLKIDFEELTFDIPGGDDALNTLGDALEVARESLGMHEFYTVYLRNYCQWNDDDIYANCTSPKPYFWFNPIKVWGLDREAAPMEEFLSPSFRDGLDAYHKASKAQFVAYAAALAASALTILVGFSAIFSRWGSFVTTFFATAATIAYIAGSVIATAMFVILRKVLNEELADEFRVFTTVGNRALTVSWIGTALATAAGLFWFMSVCCCSGRSPYNKDGGRASRGKTRAEKTPYTYERVGSPYMGPNAQQAVPLGAYNGANPTTQKGSAYEPFRSHA